LSRNSHLGCQFVPIGKELERREPRIGAAPMEKDYLTLRRASVMTKTTILVEAV
jgi:hypothetical protein